MDTLGGRRIRGRRLPRCAHAAADFVQQLGDAGAGGGGDRPQLDAALGTPPLQLRDVRGRSGVDLVGGYDLRLGRDRRVEQRQLAVDDVEVVERVTPGRAAGVEQVEEQ